MLLPPAARKQLYEAEANRQDYYARRNASAAKSHRKTRCEQLAQLGINPDTIKSLTSRNRI